MNTKGDNEIHQTMMFFNTRQDVLTAIVKNRSNVKGHLGDLHIVNIENDEVEFAYHPPPTGERKELTIKFLPPLANAWAAKPRLKHWRDIAYEKYKVPARPKVDYFNMPAMFPFTAPAVIALSVLLFLIFGDGIHLAEVMREFVERQLGSGVIKYAGYFAAAMHLVIEPMFMISLCYKYSTPIGPALKWILCNMVVGYGALDEFRECVMYERMRVIYSQTDVGDVGPRVKSINATAEKKAQ